MNTSSYTSANSYPIKLLQYSSDIIKNGFRPIHPQIYATNKCNLSCEFCSCKGEDRRLEMDKDYIYDIVETFSGAYVDAVTFSGGGEPLLFKHLEFMIKSLLEQPNPPRFALVSNGLAIPNYDICLWQKFDWIRISMDGNRKNIPTIPGVHSNKAYSWVYRPGDETNPNLLHLQNLALEGKISHLRIVSDILDDDCGVILGEKIKPSEGTIIQTRHNHRKGSKRCYMPLIKPVFTPSGVYTCCGAQYAIKGKEGKMPDELKIADDPWDFKNNFMAKNQPFDGSICDKCYYHKYNNLIESIVNARNVSHPSFI